MLTLCVLLLPWLPVGQQITAVSGAETVVSSNRGMEEGGEALPPSPLHRPTNFPVSSCPEGPLQTGEWIEVVVFLLAVTIGGFCDVDPCPASAGLG